MGVASKEKVKIRNHALVPCDVSCSIPTKYKNEIIFQPENFRLKGNEVKEVYCTFIPKKSKPYCVTAKLAATSVYDVYKDLIGFFNPGSGNLHAQHAGKHAHNVNSNSNQDKKFEKMTSIMELLIVGAGADGSIEITPQIVDYGTVKVGDQLVRSVTLHNKSKANVYVELNLIPLEESDSNEKLINQQFKYDFRNGIIHAHSKKTVSIYFKPITRC